VFANISIGVLFWSSWKLGVLFIRSLLRGFETSLLSLPSSFGIARCPPLDLVLMSG
jgi:hypothetical protein